MTRKQSVSCEEGSEFLIIHQKKLVLQKKKTWNMLLQYNKETYETVAMIVSACLYVYNMMLIFKLRN